MFTITTSEFSILKSSVKITDEYEDTKINKFLDLLRNKGINSFAIVDDNNLYAMKKVDNMVNADGPKYAKTVLQKELGRAPTEDEVKEYLKEHGNYFKPVYGINLTIESMFLPKPTKIHIFAKNQNGMRKLVILSTKIKCDEDENPEAAISLEFLKNTVKSNDVIAFTGGDASEINILFDKGFEKEAKYMISIYQDIFGKDNLFLELSSTKTVVAEYMWKIASSLKKEFGIKPVVTNEAFYVDKTHYKAHSYLTQMKDDSKLKFYHINHVNYNDEFYIKSETEMRNSLSSLKKESEELLEEAFENTKAMENLCNATPITEEIDFNFFPTPGNIGVNKFVKDLTIEGFKERFPDSTYLKNGLTYNDYLERLRFEIKIIEEMGFLGYFAIVQDYIQFAKDDKIEEHLDRYFPSWKFKYDDIPDKFKKKNFKINIGPGRGSAAGSLVAYCLKITDRLEPIANDLLFERFLNPERVSMPDIDVDFPKSGREFCYDYVKFKYNYNPEVTKKEEHVSSIITFGTLKTKNLILKLGKALSIPLKLREEMSKRVPDAQMNLTTVKNEPYFTELVKNDDNVKLLFEYGVVLENLPVNTSVHAAGVIISQKNLTDYVPLQKVDGTLIIQIDKTECEEVGLLKFDFLGLITLDLEDKTWQYIKENFGLDPTEIPMDDEETFKLMQAGRTEMCFQIESQGMKKILRDINCNNFEEVNATIALFRPGPMEFIPDYVNGKLKPSDIIYPHPIYKQYTEETYGVIVYQEQIMKLVQALAGFSLGKADNLRKAISKKKDSLINALRVDFIKGCKETNNIDEALANEIFDRIKPFARYGFNRSHSAAYAIIAYDTAYLKAHFPLEFMAANLTIGNSNRDKEIAMLSYAKNNYTLLPPDIRKSKADFKIETQSDGTKAIRFGLEKIQGVGIPLAEAIENTDIPEKINNLEELYSCIDDKSLLKTDSMERIIDSGALDNYLPNRHRLSELNKPTIAAVKARDEYRGTLLDFVPVMTPKVLAYEYPSLEKINKERKAIGVMLSGHILDSYHINSTSNIYDALEDEDTEVKDVLVFVEDFHEIITKKGSKMAFLKVSDQFSQTSCVVFPKEYEKLEEHLRTIVNKAVIMTVSVSVDSSTNEKNLILQDLKEISNSSTKNLFVLDINEFNKVKTKLSTINGISKVFYLSGNKSAPLYETTFCVDFMKAKELLDKEKVPYTVSD